MFWKKGKKGEQSEMARKEESMKLFALRVELVAMPLLRPFIFSLLASSLEEALEPAPAHREGEQDGECLPAGRGGEEGKGGGGGAGGKF